MKHFPILLLLTLPLSPQAFAAGCADKPGQAIFEDNFADNTGGWASDPEATFGGGLKMHFGSQDTYWTYWNKTFNATTGDFCMEAVAPQPAGSGNTAVIGLAFLLSDADNMYVFQWGSDNTLSLWRDSQKHWSEVADYSKSAGVVQPGSPIVLEVNVSQNLITSSFNGTEVGKLRAQIPQASLQFGIYMQTDKAVPDPGYDFEIKDYRVTAPP
jgi:hypothetical protein